MRVFEDRTKVEIDGLAPYEQPSVETVVVRYRPEEGGYYPTILLVRTDITVPDDAPAWVWEPIEEEIDRGRLKLVLESAHIRPELAAVIRQAIVTHDDTVAAVRAAIEKAARDREA